MKGIRAVLKVKGVRPRTSGLFESSIEASEHTKQQNVYKSCGSIQVQDSQYKIFENNHIVGCKDAHKFCHLEVTLA